MKIRSFRLALFIMLCALPQCWQPGIARAATLTVTNTRDSGPGSLRQAIVDADAASSGSPIQFNILTSDAGFNAAKGTFTLHPASALPTLTANNITLDGSTQTSFSGNTNGAGPEIIISGAAQLGDGLVIKGANCCIRGLVVHGFGGAGINLTGPRATANRVEGCFIGTDAKSLAAVPNFIGISMNAGAHANLVGGTTVGARNVISGNGTPGVFGGMGVFIGDKGSNGNVVRGNYIGTNAGGTAAIANADNGIAVAFGAQHNVIGGSSPDTRNIIAGNINYGIFIAFANTNNNLVQGNYIGTNLNGTSALPNGYVGVGIIGGASNNTIGGTITNARNVISGNKNEGVHIADIGTKGNIVSGNYIGANAAGARALPNGYSGIGIYNGAQNNVIGGTTVGARNVISGSPAASYIDGVHISDKGTSHNLVQGNYIGTNAAGTAAIPSGSAGVSIINGAHDNLVGGATVGARNLISGNKGSGLFIGFVGTDNNVIQGNYIGVTANGAAALPNAVGIYIDGGAKNNIIGGITPVTRNIIAGNKGDGIHITDKGTTNNIVQGNYIGTNPAGTVALPNLASGVALVGGAGSNTIGGTLTGARNVISGNFYGVYIGGSNSNQTQGNYIGTNAVGTGAVPNRNSGVFISAGSQNNVIGGTLPGARNVIAGNIANGIWIPGAAHNIVQGNYIGTNATGTGAVPNRSNGVAVTDGAQANTIGGLTLAARNIIAGNTTGIFFAHATANAVQGNVIGLGASGTAVPNNDGIVISNAATTNTIGGTNSAARNIISGNRDSGVSIVQDGTNHNRVQSNLISHNGKVGVQVSFNSTGNTIRQNAIFDNGGLGINLQPSGEPDNTVTPNDPGDADTGPNNLQNFPVLTGVTDNSGTTSISGTLNSIPDSSFDLDFYRNSIPDPSGYGQGEVYLGSTRVSTDSSGNAVFSMSQSGGITGQFFTATATNSNTGDTSEFAKAVPVAASAGLQAERAAGVALSSSRVNRAQSSIQLVFSGALDRAVAVESEHYTVQVNGQAVAVESVAYNAAAQQINLGLAPARLQPGDQVAVTWQGLQDRQGRVSAGSSKSLAVPW